jgi:hypothetical protein
MDANKHVGGAVPLYGYRDLHDIFMEVNEKGEQRLNIERKKVIPSAEEIEKNYDHGPGVGALIEEKVEWSAPQ